LLSLSLLTVADFFISFLIDYLLPLSRDPAA